MPCPPPGERGGEVTWGGVLTRLPRALETVLPTSLPVLAQCPQPSCRCAHYQQECPAFTALAGAKLPRPSLSLGVFHSHGGHSCLISFPSLPPSPGDSLRSTLPQSRRVLFWVCEDKEENGLLRLPESAVVSSRWPHEGAGHMPSLSRAKMRQAGCTPLSSCIGDPGLPVSPQQTGTGGMANLQSTCTPLYTSTTRFGHQAQRGLRLPRATQHWLRLPVPLAWG